MSTFLALPNRSSAPDIFRKFSIPDLMPGAVSEIVVMCVNDAKEYNTAYAMLMNGITTQAYAIMTKQPRYQNSFYPVFPGIFPEHFDTPTMSIRFAGISDDIRTTLQGFGLREDATAGGAWVGSPRITDFTQIMKLKNQDTSGRVHLGCVTPEGYYAYITLLRGLALFQTMSRKAILSNHYAHYGLHRHGDFHDIDVDNPMVKLRMFFDTTEEEEYPAANVGLSSNGAVLSSSIFPIFAPHTDTAPLESAFFNLVPDQINDWMEDGRYFPYFQGLLLPDKEYPMHVFLRLFTKGMGSSSERAAHNIERARNGYRILANKSAGLAMSHAYLGIELALNAQLEITFCVSNHSYAGFVLRGRDFTVFYRGQKIHSATAREVQEAMKGMVGQETILQSIQGVINGKLDSSGDPLYSVDLVSSTSSRYLLGVLHSVDWTKYSQEEIKDIGSSLCRLRMDQKFAPVTRETLGIFLSYVESGNRDLLKEYSANLDHSFKEKGAVAVGLGIFGSRPPTISYGIQKGNTSIFTLPEPGKTDPNLTAQNGVFPYPDMPYQLLDFPRAVAQWNSVFSTGKILLPKAPKMKKIKYFTDPKQVSGKIAKEHYVALYERIKQISKNIRGIDAGTGKRKRIGEEGAKKKARVIEDDDMEL